MNPKVDKVDFGNRIRKAREEKGMTQAEVAKVSGINTNYYTRIERGEVNPSYEKILSIVKALKIKSSDILPF